MKFFMFMVRNCFCGISHCLTHLRRQVKTEFGLKDISDTTLTGLAVDTDNICNALKKAYELKYTLETYQEHALERSSSSKAIAYVGIKKPDGTLAWGAGVDPDIIRASIDALVTAINNR